MNKSIIIMFNKLAFLVIIGIGASVGVSILDQKIKASNSTETATQRSQRAAPVRSNRQRVTAISAGDRGQFSVSALVNGVHVEMMADTGATLVVLTAEDAERIGIDLEWLEFNAPILTANGRAMTARMVLDNINIGGIEVSNVNALITQPGLLTHSLLGMSYLSKLTKFEIKGDQLVLYR